MKNEIKETISRFLIDIKNTGYFPKIQFIILYGSYLTDYHLDDSDIDICIYIQDDIQKLSRIRLELLKLVDDKFDIQIFQILPIYVQIEVLKGEILYLKEKNLLYEIAYETIEEFEDFYPFYSDYINR